MLWSVTSFLCEVPSGALADTVSRRGLLALSGVLYTACFASWLLFPGYWGFLTGFMLWGVSSSLQSGTFEALLYDELAQTGRTEAYARVRTRAETAAVVAIAAGMLAAGPLVMIGGYRAVGVASVVAALLHTALTSTLPAAPARQAVADHRYVAHLRTGLREVRRAPAVRRTIFAIAVLAGLVSFDEYFALFFAAAGLSPAQVTIAMAATAVAQAIGTAAAGRRGGVGRRAVLTLIALGGGGFVLGSIAATTRDPEAAVAAAVLVVAGYGLVTTVYVAEQNRLQGQIRGTARATVTSVSGVLAEVGAIAGFAMVGGLARWWSVPLVVLLVVLPFTGLSAALSARARPRAQ